jgi:hypothetical protein
MNTSTKVLLGIGGGFILLIVVALFGVMGANNTWVQMEAGIKAQYDQNRNNYDNMWKKFKEASQVTSMYTDDLKKVYDGVVQGRYGGGGSRALFQMIKEHNPNFDGSMYKNLQVMIESGRNTFESNQKMLLDKKRLYEIEIQSFPNSIFAHTLGFPKINLAKYDIVTSGATEQAFETKKADEIKLR